MVVVPPKSIKRILDLSNWLKHKSVLLLGPRQTGKSTLIKTTFPKAKVIDLLESDTFREYSAHPELLRQRLKPSDKILVIDEIQKLPELLDEIQAIVDRNRALRVILTGSSARKLKRGKANLLGGRLLPFELFPLTQKELGFKNLDHHLLWGGLPGIFNSEIPAQELKAYIGVYLQEEIQAEGLTRSLPQFSRFLEIVGLVNAEQINYTQVASDAGIPVRTVRDHFQILLDTMVAFSLPTFKETKKRKAVTTEKFYLFDTGVAHVFSKQKTLDRGTPAFGKALEHRVALELIAWNSYLRKDMELAYWRSQSHFEVDFTLGGDLAIEVKAKGQITDRDLKGLRALKEEKIFRRHICISLEREPRKTEDGIEILPFALFFEELWDS